MKRYTVLPAILLSLISLASMNPATAQGRRPPGTASLGEMGCTKTSGAKGYSAFNGDIVIGRQVLRGIATMGGTNEIFDAYVGISSREATESVCRLAAPTERPRFRTLTLAFGIPDNTASQYSNAVNIRLSVYKDGNFYSDYTITKGRPVRAPIDVTGTRSLAISVECVHSGGGSECPMIAFFEDILEE